MKRIFCVLMVTLAVTKGHSQTLPKVYNQFFMNPYIYNPAYAGVEGHAVVFAMYKDQWSGIDGGPTLSHVNFHVPLKGGLAFGALVYNEQNGLYNQSGGKISGGYLINFDRTHFLRFGLSLGAGNNTLDFGELDSPTDPAFSNLLATETFYIGDVGATYHFGHFNVGIALPSLFAYDLFSTESNTMVSVRPQDNALLKMNYRGHINDDLAVEPHLLYRYHKYLPNQYEATMIVHLLHIVWVGATYRQDAGLVGLIGAKVKEKLGIGYSYEYGNAQTASLLGPTHEIHIGLHLGTKKDHAEHVSSFIKSHRKDAEERAKEAELERQKKLQALQRSRQAAAAEASTELGLLAGAKEEEKVSTNWNYEQENDPVERVNQFGETERGVKFDRVNEKGEKEVVFSWLPPPPPGTTSETYKIANPDKEPLIRTGPNGKKEAGITWIRTIDGNQKETLVIWDEILSQEAAEEIDHNPAVAMSMEDAVISITRKQEPEEVPQEPEVEEVPQEPEVEEPVNVDPTPVPPPVENVTGPSDVVKRGGHLLELPEGNYVVAGVFRSFELAENESDRLFLKGFRDTRVGYLSARGYYYVVVFESGNVARATTERNRIRKMNGLSEVWVLTVHE